MVRRNTKTKKNKFDYILDDSQNLVENETNDLISLKNISISLGKFLIKSNKTTLNTSSYEQFLHN